MELAFDYIAIMAGASFGSPVILLRTIPDALVFYATNLGSRCKLSRLDLL